MNERMRAEFEEWLQQNRRYQFVGKEFVHTDDLRAFFARYAGSESEAVAWKHSCAALLTDGVELWINACPHCGKPRPPAQENTSPTPAVPDGLQEDARRWRWIRDNFKFVPTLDEHGSDWSAPELDELVDTILAASQAGEPPATHSSWDERYDGWAQMRRGCAGEQS